MKIINTILLLLFIVSTHTSFAQNNIDCRLRTINGNLNMESESGECTTATIRIELT